MLDFEKPVQGLALYIEMRRPNSTIQVLITPEGFTPANGVQNPVFFRRTLHYGMTKRKWRAYPMGLSKPLQEALTRGTGYENEDFERQQAVRLQNLSNYFRSAVAQGFKIINEPLYLETTKDDIDSAIKGTIPTKLWTRVKSARVAKGYPEEVTMTREQLEAVIGTAPATTTTEPF